MEEFKFLQKKTNRETLDTELITPQWKKKFIEENYNRIVETFLNHDMSLYQNFIKLLLNKKKDNDGDDDDEQNFSFEELSPFLTEEAKNKVKKGILLSKKKEYYNFQLVLSDQTKKSFSFFKKPKLISHIHGQDTIDHYFIPNIESFQIFQKTQQKYSFNFLKNKDLQTIYNNTFFKFGDENFYLFCTQNNEIKLDFNKLNQNNLFTKNIKKLKDVEPNLISPIFNYYLNIDQLSENNYIYYNTDKRKELLKKLISLMESSCLNSFAITGGKGTGKSSMLLFLSSLNILNIFYFNLSCFYRRTIKSTKIALKFEVNRLLSGFYRKQEDLKNFYDYIDSINVDTDPLIFINKFMNVLKDFIEKNQINSNFYIIIDQFSDEIKHSDGKLNGLILTSNEIPFISIIISATLNKDFANEYLYITLMNNYKYRLPLYVYYLPKLFSDKDIDNFTKLDNSNFKKKFKQFKLPYFYYYSKENNFEFSNYIELIKKEIIAYYNEDYFSHLINLMTIVKNNYLLTSSYFLKIFKFIPLKYVEIQTKEINSNEFNEISKNLNQNNLNILLIKNQFLEKYNSDSILKEFLYTDTIQENLSILLKKKKYFPSKFEENLKKFESIKDMKIPDSEIIVIKINFLFPFFEFILMSMIYEYITQEFNNFKNIVDNGTLGGLFEVLVIYNIFKNKNIAGIEIDEFISISSLVPNNFSIKYYITKNEQKNNKREFINIDELIQNKNELVDLKLNVYGIFQTNFNSKYFDFAIIMKNSNDNTFILIVFQISIKKEKKKLYDKKEIELILYYVKKNIEGNFNVKISSAYFYYILSAIGEKINDEYTLNFCKKNKLSVIPFCLKEMNFTLKINLNIDNSLITKKFPPHNEKSLIKSGEESNNFYLNISGLIDNSIFNDEIDEDLFQDLFSFFNYDKLKIDYIQQITSLTDNSKDNYIYFSNFAFVLCEQKNFNDKIIFFNGKAYNLKSRKIISNRIINRINTTLYCSLIPLKIIIK